MFTDVVGFAALTHSDEGLAMELLEGQRALLRPVIGRNGGREVKTIGDAFLVEFASSLDAVKCAYEMQAMMKEANAGRPRDRRIMIRVGIHLGDVIHSQGDVAGDAVNLASRVEPLALPGGICVTAPVYASVVNKVPFSFESMGTPKLKNIATPIEVFRVASLGEPAARTEDTQQPGRIAVLPFVNFSPDQADEYFSDGMTEEVIASISNTQGLRVIARTSVMKYKGANKPVSEVAKELGVASVVEGSVRKAGHKVRISVQLVDASSEEPRWSQEYDRDLEDVFAVQTDIARKVAEALRVRVLGAAARPTASREAYVYYLRGRQAWNRRDEAGLKDAVGLFQMALASDPNYAKAYTGLADSYATLALLELVAPNEAYPKAKEAVGRALSIDPLLAEAHTSLGLMRFQYDWDWKGAEEEFREAVRLNPSYAPAHHYYADFLKAMGRFDEAVAEIEKARELDPLNLAINTGVGHVLYLSRRYDEAIAQYKRAVELDPKFMLTHVWFGRPYLEKGMYAEAISELETAVNLSGESTLALAMLGHGFASAGRKSEAMAALAKLEARAKARYVPSYWIAVIYSGFMDREHTLPWLKKAFEERSSWLVWTNVEPRFDWLRGDPEFAAMMESMRFP
jgi:adenylate cyclase